MNGRHQHWDEIINWVNRMAQKYNGEVVEDKNGKSWDWGQALCRELYGENWMENELFKEANMTEDSESFPEWERCKKAMEDWENGNVPNWVVTPK